MKNVITVKSSERTRLFDRTATKRPQNEASFFFTHPIFESDFDCLTGKTRHHANSLLSLSPLTKLKS
jgi:hypothetical protein